MKGHTAHHHMAHKAKKHRNTGGTVAHDKAPKEVYAGAGSHVVHEAEEKEGRKHGGRTKRKHGGHVMHHHTGHVKHVGAVHGEHAKHHAGRKPRKSGGSVESNPFSAARKGTPAKGRKEEMEFE